jgi:hypothetical protein
MIIETKKNQINVKIDANSGEKLAHARLRPANIPINNGIKTLLLAGALVSGISSSNVVEDTSFNIGKKLELKEQLKVIKGTSNKSLYQSLIIRGKAKNPSKTNEVITFSILNNENDGYTIERSRETVRKLPVKEMVSVTNEQQSTSNNITGQTNFIGKIPPKNRIDITENIERRNKESFVSKGTLVASTKFIGSIPKRPRV